MKKEIILKNVSLIIIVLFALAFVAKLAGPSFLRLYVASGVGNCESMPILCMAPTEAIINPPLNREYLQELIPHNFPKIAILVPKGFSVVEERIKKVYYKKMKRQHSDAAIYLLYQEPNFFINLFPRLQKQGVIDDYEFLRRIMFANLKNIKNLTDVFFVIMKGIFIPGLGDGEGVRMAQFIVGDKKGFLNYAIGRTDNYFDCNIINRQGDFFKIYIKDKGARLDLDKLFTIIAMVDKAK